MKDGAKPEIDEVIHDIDGANHVKQSSTLQSSLVMSNIVYFSLIQSNQIDRVNYEMGGAKQDIDYLIHEMDGANHVKQLSTLQSSQAK